VFVSRFQGIASPCISPEEMEQDNLTHQPMTATSITDTPARAGAALQSLIAAKERYSEQNPVSLQRWKFATTSMPGGNTRTVLFFDPFPLCMDRAEGAVLFDVDGHQYYDLLGEYSAGIYGHSHPLIKEAIVAALDSGLALSAHNALEADLARLICTRFKSIELLRFTNSGTEANIMALATAVAVTGRKRILVFEGAYHGSVLSFADPPSVTNLPYDFVIAPYNQTERVRALLSKIGQELAAVLVEPMLGAGGCTPADPAFLAMLATETKRVGALLIFDEIQTSRLSPGGRQQLLGIKPDLTTLGKYFGGGLTFGAFGGRRDLMSHYDPRRPDHFSHPGTFNNNVLSMAAGVAGQRVLAAEALGDLNARGDALRNSLNEQFGRLDANLYATGLGSIMNLHVRADRHYARVARELLFFSLLARGFYIANRGLITLSLPVTDKMTSSFVSAIRDVIETHREVFCT
jgi:glutamate-1-semialdehyde 2,1-aminomutase